MSVNDFDKQVPTLEPAASDAALRDNTMTEVDAAEIDACVNEALGSTASLDTIKHGSIKKSGMKLEKMHAKYLSVPLTRRADEIRGHEGCVVIVRDADHGDHAEISSVNNAD